MKRIEESYDVIIVGAGHAGCEAALACARLGLETILFTISAESIAMMPCNPNIGGTSKGHLVRELDALGGEMGKNIDRTFIQSKMLNLSKGPAVHSLRAQADKQAYSNAMRKTLEETSHLTIRQAEVAKIVTRKEDNKGEIHKLKVDEESRCGVGEEVERGVEEEMKCGVDGAIRCDVVVGVKTVSGAFYRAPAVVLCTGTYLKARCIHGEVSEETGPNGLQRSSFLSDSLQAHGIAVRRFKTGTPARIAGNTIDYTRMEEQFGDERIIPFSFSTDPDEIQKEQVSCWLTYTNKTTQQIIMEDIHRSPLYSGVIEGTGPRYCPSIEDKVVKFPDKERHQVFIEPEGKYTNEMYISGMSSSLPEDVQKAMYQSVAGLEHAKIVKYAYAIEYDCIDARQLKPTLEFKAIRGLFSGGQFNGSSGYEEAAAQGFIAGVNAAMERLGKEQIVLNHSEAYIGVLIDDLVTKENREPYRMMTSRAEYRLLLRQDNADLRLRGIGRQIGLIDEPAYQAIKKKEQQIEEEIKRIESCMIGAGQKTQEVMHRLGSQEVKTAVSLAELIRRPELDYQKTAELDPGRSELPEDVIEQVNINIKYDGYIRRQKKQIREFLKMEGKKIPQDIDYQKVNSLRIEARQKLEDLRPANIGQAGRIAGVTPADISVLLVYLKANGIKDENADKSAKQ